MTLDEARERWPVGSRWRRTPDEDERTVLDWVEIAREVNVVWNSFGRPGWSICTTKTWQRWAKERCE